ncbi:MAG TPA: CHASE domain-containing protein [Afifellaceae bacterium]|nr:CHASE domain-containing protein [Afifellaceae bacterium]
MGWRGARFRRLYFAYGIPLAVLALGLLFTVYVTQTLREIDEARNQERFSELVSEAHNTIEARLGTYIALLRAGVGFYSEMDGPSGDQFRRFVRHLQLEESYRGIQGFGFSERVPASRLAEFVEARQTEGPSDFQIWPDTPREEYHVIKYLEPLDARNRRALGYDMYTEAVRQEAMQRARDTGAPAASGKVVLVQETGRQIQPGFLIYLPVYEGGATPDSVPERRERLVGFMYSPFRAGDLFRSILSRTVTEEVAFQVFDGDPAPENVLYSSSRLENIDPSFSAVRPLGFAGRKWTIDFQSLPSFEAGARSPTVDIMPLIGIIFSILLAAIAAGQVQARIAAQREARERRRAEAAVAEREQQLRRVLDSIFAFIGVLDTDGRIVEVNRAPLEATGLDRDELIGQIFWASPLWSGEAEPAREAVRSAVERAAAGEVVRQDVPLRLGDELRTLDLQIAPLNDSEGNVAYLLPFGVDVTERRRAEEHQATLMAELSHRVKNSLAVIQSLARQTGTRARSVPEFMEAFQGRLSALGAAHSLLIDTGWRTTRLDSVIRMSARPHLVREAEQLTLSIQPISISPELAQNMALVVHELATNAVKYGALASAGGRILVDGKVEGDQFVLVWREQKPSAIDPPGEPGFGTTLLKALIASRHHGDVKFDWAANGLICTITIPTSELRAAPDRRNVFAEHAAAPAPDPERVAS